MTLSRNNTLFYYGTADKLSTAGDLQSAVGVLSRFDMIVVKQSLASSANDLLELLLGYKLVRPSGKVFGYTAFTTDLGTFQTAVDGWTLSYAGQIAGIYIDNFGAADRATQNAMVSYVHGKTLQSMVNPSPQDLIQTLEQIPGSLTATVLGSISTIRDMVLVNDFYIKNANSLITPHEGQESLVGRMLFAKGALTPPGSITALNLGYVGVIGAGLNTVVTETDYIQALAIANQYGLDGVAVVPFDIGASGNYFERAQASVFAP